jgi:hypothetical protein
MTITNPYYVSCEQWHPRDCFASLGWCYICRHNGHRLQECPFLGWGCYYYGGCRTCAASRRSPTLTHVCVWSIWGDKEFLADPPIFGHCQQRRGFTCRQPRWRVEETRDHCSYSSRSLPDTVLLVQKAIPVNSRLFWGFYCNFHVIFVYLFWICILYCVLCM